MFKGNESTTPRSDNVLIVEPALLKMVHQFCRTLELATAVDLIALFHQTVVVTQAEFTRLCGHP